ncbi:MAG: hypothetical protein EXX96DRAFT_612687 [Benjaminiella poitrasii]|nr:MAG: hypothetical protein EXX96DRAFT_612687 [Benjaminiella poitrasii]
MNQSRSTSVPLLHIGGLHNDDVDDNSDIELSNRLTRSSFSFTSLQQILASRPVSPNQQLSTSSSSSSLLLWHNDDLEDREILVPLNDHSDNDSCSILSSCSSDGEENATRIAITGKRTKGFSSSVKKQTSDNNKDTIASVKDLSSDIMYEDIWIDSPVFHDYLHSLEGWLYHYLTWLEKVEQCRQLEIAYNKAVHLLYEQTKIILNEPFYTAEECSNLNWSNNDSGPSLVDNEVWENEKIRLVLPYLRNHGTKIKEILTRYENSVSASRIKHMQLSSNYCASQKYKSQANNKSFDDICNSLYTSKRTLCKVLLEYVYALNTLIRTTRELINERLGPLFEGLQSDKGKNLKNLEELVLIATRFVYGLNVNTPMLNSKAEDSAVSLNTTSYSSFDDYHELNHERLSYYIQEKLASYYNYLRVPVKPLSNENSTSNGNKTRSTSPTSFPFTFLNKSKAVHTILESVLPVQPNSLMSTSSGNQLTIKGYLFLKNSAAYNTSSINSGINNLAIGKDGSSHSTGKWERYYFYITKEDGYLRQYKDPTITMVVADLRTVNICAPETEKRDFAIQIDSHNIPYSTVCLQAETAVDFSNWLQALRSWNQHHIDQIENIPTRRSLALNSRKSSTYHTRCSTAETHSTTKKIFLTKKSNTAPENADCLQMDHAYNTRKNNSIDILSPVITLRASPTNFVSNSENTNGERLIGYPIPVSNCPVDCCNASGVIKNAKIQMTGSFRIHKSCINKLSCASHHSGTLCVLHVALFEDNILHLQTEKVDNSFFHRPIQLSTLSPQDIYSFSDTIMRYCIVIRPAISETYHLITCSKVQRDAWLARLKRICNLNNVMTCHPRFMAFPSRTVFSLTIRISEGRKFQVSHKDSIHSELNCDVVVDYEIRGWTGSLKKTSTMFWREDFLFSDIAKIRHGITINVYSKNNKNDRETIYGSLFLPARQIHSGNMIQEDWYEVRKETSNRNRAFVSLTSLGSSNPGTVGQLRIGTLLEKHHVFSLEVYQPLMDVLTEFRHDVIYDMARKTTDLQGLSRNLLRIYEGMGLSFAWIKSLIDYEVTSLSSDDVNILFRGNSFFTKVIENYMKMSGREFLEEALQFTIQKICKFSLYIEVESSRLPSRITESMMKSNCTELFSHVRSIWGGIQRAKIKCPIKLRRIFGHLQSAVVKKFHLGKESLDRHHQVAKYTCVSGFIFLRWICPAIISPKQFGLVQDHPDMKTCRTLTLIAKCLMTLASYSSVEQNAKEPWMICLNDFVQDNTQHLMNFINFVSMDDENLSEIDNNSKTEEVTIPSSHKRQNQQDEVFAPYFIDLPFELAQFTNWCFQECHFDNTITHTCKTIIDLQRGYNPIHYNIQKDNNSNESFLTANTPSASNNDNDNATTSSNALTTKDIMLQQVTINNRRKTRPQPWQYGEDYLVKENEVLQLAK